MLTFRFRIPILNMWLLDVCFHSSNQANRDKKKTILVSTNLLRDVVKVFLFLLLQRVEGRIFLHNVSISFCLSTTRNKAQDDFKYRDRMRTHFG